MLCTMALHHVLLPQKTKNKHFLSYSGGRARLLCPPCLCPSSLTFGASREAQGCSEGHGCLAAWSVLLVCVKNMKTFKADRSASLLRNVTYLEDDFPSPEDFRDSWGFCVLPATEMLNSTFWIYSTFGL